MYIDARSCDSWNTFIYLDGFRIDHVTKADDKAGWVEVEVRDPANGGPMVDWAQGLVVTKRLYGSIRIVICDTQRQRDRVQAHRQHRYHLLPCNRSRPTGQRLNYVRYVFPAAYDERTKVEATGFAKGGPIRGSIPLLVQTMHYDSIPHREMSALDPEKHAQTIYAQSEVNGGLSLCDQVAVDKFDKDYAEAIKSAVLENKPAFRLIKVREPSDKLPRGTD